MIHTQTHLLRPEHLVGLSDGAAVIWSKTSATTVDSRIYRLRNQVWSVFNPLPEGPYTDSTFIDETLVRELASFATWKKLCAVTVWEPSPLSVASVPVEVLRSLPEKSVVARIDTAVRHPKPTLFVYDREHAWVSGATAGLDALRLVESCNEQERIELVWMADRPRLATIAELRLAKRRGGRRQAAS